MRCINISTRIFDGSVSCPGLYGGLYGQNLPYKLKIRMLISGITTSKILAWCGVHVTTVGHVQILKFMSVLVPRYCPFAHKWQVVFVDPLPSKMRTEGNFQARFSRRKSIGF